MNVPTLAILLLFILTSAPQAAVHAQPPPNLIIILADDMGYSDPSCFGGEIPTPALERLARDGTLLTRFHNASMCVVTRASMLTGKWWPHAIPSLKNSEILPESLKNHGYRTGLIGKWHLAGNPMDRGFDHFFGFLNGFSDHFTGSASYRLDRQTFTHFTPDYYSSDAFTDHAIDFINADQSKPFFLYLSYQAPHNPLQAPPADIQRHRGKYLTGWEATRQARFARQQQLGIVPPNASLPAYPQNLPQWEKLTEPQKDLEDLRMATYAAMIERMDQGIGRLIQNLELTNRLDNTFILFLSDNGADPFSVVDQTMLKQNKLPGDRASNWQLGNGWAHTSVTPWRLYKISQHAGGVTTGAIAHWPAGIKNHSTINHSPIHVIDILPTFLDLSGHPVPDSVGTSFRSLLSGANTPRTEPMFFQYADNRAIRTPQWTLAAVDGGDWQLFDIKSDPLETTNIAADNANVVAELDAQWQAWWLTHSKQSAYQPQSTNSSPHYKSQGDQGSGSRYVPSAMPARLSNRFPIPAANK